MATHAARRAVGAPVSSAGEAPVVPAGPANGRILELDPLIAALARAVDRSAAIHPPIEPKG